jgi:hypothetical protein
MESGAEPGLSGSRGEVGDFPQMAGRNPQVKDVRNRARAA